MSYLAPEQFAIEATGAAFHELLEIIYKALRLDATRINELDPAATNMHEVILSYSGFMPLRFSGFPSVDGTENPGFTPYPKRK